MINFFGHPPEPASAPWRPARADRPNPTAGALDGVAVASHGGVQMGPGDEQPDRVMRAMWILVYVALAVMVLAYLALVAFWR